LFGLAGGGRLCLCVELQQPLAHLLGLARVRVGVGVRFGLGVRARARSKVRIRVRVRVRVTARVRVRVACGMSDLSFFETPLAHLA